MNVAAAAPNQRASPPAARMTPLNQRRQAAKQFRSDRKDKEQWEQIREEFTRLYKHEKLPLREVMSRLAEQGFVAR